MLFCFNDNCHIKSDSVFIIVYNDSIADNGDSCYFSLIGTVFHGSSQNGSNIVPALLKIQEKQETSSTSEKEKRDEPRFEVLQKNALY